MVLDSPKRSRRWRGLALVALGFVVYVAMNYPAVRNLYVHCEARGLRRTLAMTAYLCGGYVAFLPLLLAIRRSGAVVLGALVSVSVVGNFIFSSIFGGKVLTGEVVDWLLAEYRQAPKAWVEFRVRVVASFALTAAVVSALFLLRKELLHASPVARTLGRRPIQALALLAFAFYQAVPFMRPVPFAMTEGSLITYGVAAALFTTSPEPRMPSVAPDRPPAVDKIVLVVDESVTYRAYVEAIAPRLDGYPALDFGEAASIANCSAQTNALLRWGVERHAVGSPAYDPRATPHLWGYARGAGMRTTLIDGQSSGVLQNFLTVQELRQVDEFVPALAGFETDRRIATMVNQRLRRPGRDLIYVVKRGVHFPFHHASPEGVVSTAEPKTVQHTAAVAWFSASFFDQLTHEVDFSRVLLVYTSDHGQDFESTRSTHCNPSPEPVEYSVPLVVFTEARPLADQLRAALPDAQGRASHAAIFPTFLEAMGYPRHWTEATYGTGLTGSPKGYLTLEGHLPFPHWRERTVRFAMTRSFPGVRPQDVAVLTPSPQPDAAAEVSR